MKKKSINSLKLRKSTVSNLNKTNGGADATLSVFICPTPPVTILCSVLIKCQSLNDDCYNSRNRCQTIERDQNTLPIC